jgi:hypothetical protein
MAQYVQNKLNSIYVYNRSHRTTQKLQRPAWAKGS